MSGQAAVPDRRKGGGDRTKKTHCPYPEKGGEKATSSYQNMEKKKSLGIVRNAGTKSRATMEKGSVEVNVQLCEEKKAAALTIGVRVDTRLVTKERKGRTLGERRKAKGLGERRQGLYRTDRF